MMENNISKLPFKKKKKQKQKQSFCCGAAETKPTRNQVSGSIPGLTQWVKDQALL